MAHFPLFISSDSLHFAGMAHALLGIPGTSSLMTFLKKILLVNYQPRVTAAVRTALEDTGKYLIKEERNSRHAFHAARWFQPDVILFDAVLNRPEPFAIARQIQDDPSFRETPIVFLGINASSEGGVVSEGLVNGYSFNATAVPMDELARYVAELLNPSVEQAKAPRRTATR